MAQGYYGTKISNNIIETPEGFLICKDVPICRTGWQEYAGHELMVDDVKVVEVFRAEEEVFNPVSIASYEGKPVCDGHPSEFVNPSNIGSYAKGHGQNVRHGSGEDKDFLLADLFVIDAVLISKIKTEGAREISIGYECEYAPMGDGKYQQKNIRCNHIAVVLSGRAGDKVKIRDSKFIGGLTTMKKSMWDAIAKIFESNGFKTQDDDDEVKKDACDADLPPAPSAATAQATDNDGLEAKLAALEAKIDALIESDKKVHAGMKDADDPLTAIEKELAVKDEAETKAEAEREEKEGEVKDADLIPVETMTGNEIPSNPIPGADRKAVLDAIRVLKPVVASMKDGKEKTKMVDSLAKIFRDQINQVPASSQAKDAYAKILNLKAQDAKKEEDPAEYGRSMKEKYHRKNIVK